MKNWLLKLNFLFIQSRCEDCGFLMYNFCMCVCVHVCRHCVRTSLRQTLTLWSKIFCSSTTWRPSVSEASDTQKTAHWGALFHRCGHRGGKLFFLLLTDSPIGGDISCLPVRSRHQLQLEPGGLQYFHELWWTLTQQTEEEEQQWLEPGGLQEVMTETVEGPALTGSCSLRVFLD